MGYVRVHIDEREFLDELEDEDLLREIVRRLKKRESGRLNPDVARILAQFRDVGGLAAFAEDLPKELRPKCDRLYLEWREKGNA